MNQKLEQYRVDSLFLLIGNNPLPNYVAAKTLLREGGKAYLVYTRDTKTYAEFLDELLDGNTEMVSLDIYDSDAFHIHQRVYEKANPLKNQSLGLNYTGGTKAMATHAYRALQQVKSPHPIIFSYLDPRKLEMCIDREDGERIHEKVKLQVSLDEIIRLYGLKFKSNEQPISTPQLPEAATALALLLSESEEVGKALSWWCYNVLRAEAKKDNGKDWKSKTKLEETHLSLVPKDKVCPPQHLPHLENIFSIFQQYLGASSTKLSLKTATETGGFEHPEQVCDWLAGVWLEHYVLHQVKAIAEEYDLHESKLSLKPCERDNNNHKFELDVAFMRDYQLFAISCTTDSRELCKLKLFEAYLRARQLGGDEARVALVCCTENPKDLKRQLEVVTGDDKIAVFGREHFAELHKEIGQWIKKLDREAQ